jgi:hypothetical protein
MNISMRFAVDRNKNKTIEKEEVTNPAQLAEFDRDQDGSLKGAEFTDVYYEYGTDKWLRGGRTEVVRGEGASYRVHLKELQLDPLKIDMNVDIRM